MLAWLRRIIVSVGVGAASYALMLGIMVLSIVYDQEFEPGDHLRLRYWTRNNRWLKPELTLKGRHFAFARGLLRQATLG